MATPSKPAWAGPDDSSVTELQKVFPVAPLGREETPRPPDEPKEDDVHSLPPAESDADRSFSVSADVTGEGVGTGEGARPLEILRPLPEIAVERPAEDRVKAPAAKRRRCPKCKPCCRWPRRGKVAEAAEPKGAEPKPKDKKKKYKKDKDKEAPAPTEDEIMEEEKMFFLPWFGWVWMLLEYMQALAMTGILAGSFPWAYMKFSTFFGFSNLWIHTIFFAYDGPEPPLFGVRSYANFISMEPQHFFYNNIIIWILIFGGLALIFGVTIAVVAFNQWRSGETVERGVGGRREDHVGRVCHFFRSVLVRVYLLSYMGLGASTLYHVTQQSPRVDIILLVVMFAYLVGIPVACLITVLVLLGRHPPGERDSSLWWRQLEQWYSDFTTSNTFFIAFVITKRLVIAFAVGALQDSPRLSPFVIMMVVEFVYSVLVIIRRPFRSVGRNIMEVVVACFVIVNAGLLIPWVIPSSSTNVTIAGVNALTWVNIALGIFMVAWLFALFCATMIGELYILWKEARDRRMGKNPALKASLIPLPSLLRKKSAEELYDFVWSSKGSAFKKPVSIWRARHSHGHVRFGDVVNGTSWGAPKQSPMGIDDEEVFCHAGSYSLVFSQKGVGTSDLYVWQPVPALADHVSLGFVCTASPDPPPNDSVRCVPADRVRPSSTADVIWREQGGPTFWRMPGLETFVAAAADQSNPPDNCVLLYKAPEGHKIHGGHVARKAFDGMAAYNVLLAGKHGSGKSTLLERQITGAFLTAHRPTRKAEMRSFVVETNRGPFRINTYDTPGMQKLDKVKVVRKDEIDGVVLVYDGTNKGSHAYAESRKEEAVKVYGRDVPMVVVGTKGDLSTLAELRAVEPRGEEEGYFVVSSLEGTNIERAFAYLLRQLTGDATLALINEVVPIPAIPKPEVLVDPIPGPSGSDDEDNKGGPTDVRPKTTAVGARPDQRVNEVDAAMCTAFGPGLSAVVMPGGTARFTLQAVERSGRDKQSGGDMFDVKIAREDGSPSSASPRVRDNGNGLYDVEFTAPADNRDAVLKVHISFRGTPIHDSPFSVSVGRASNIEPSVGLLDVSRSASGRLGPGRVVPCTFCGEAFPANSIAAHERSCTRASLSPSASPRAAAAAPPVLPGETMAECRGCGTLVPAAGLASHQLGCGPCIDAERARVSSARAIVGWVLEMRDKSDRDYTDGLHVEMTYPDKPAGMAGILKGDVVAAVNGVKCKSAETFKNWFEKNGEPDMLLDLTIRRDGKVIKKQLRTGASGMTIEDYRAAKEFLRAARPASRAPPVRPPQSPREASSSRR